MEKSFSIVHSFNKLLLSADYVSEVVLLDGDKGGVINNSQTNKEIDFIQAVAATRVPYTLRSGDLSGVVLP